ncbi:MAG: winged helix-turn-helix transcriptional regulator [Chloroflexi bacterium]|nr:winged helix-turn-helix transcriptional regulator [Chloroflexota bacterium]
MNPRSIFDLQAELCKTMGNPARLRVVHALREGPRCVSGIMEATGLAQAKVSQHLSVLRAHGILATERQGREIIYRIANPKIVSVCDLMREVLREQAEERTEIIQAIQVEA